MACTIPKAILIISSDPFSPSRNIVLELCWDAIKMNYQSVKVFVRRQDAATGCGSWSLSLGAKVLKRDPSLLNLISFPANVARHLDDLFHILAHLFHLLLSILGG